MADRVYPSAKPNAQPLNGGGGGPQPFPATKSQLYGATRPAYRPQPPPSKRRRSRSCCAACCLWLALILLALVLAAAIAAGVFYVVYRPHRPSFSVSSLRLSTLNLTAANLLSSKLDIAVVARNPNRKLSFLYGPTAIAVSSAGVDIADGSFPPFLHDPKNTTVLRAAASSAGQQLDTAAAADLRKTSIPLEIRLETKAGVKIGGFKTKRIGIRVTCVGISVAPPKAKAKAAAVANAADASCKVKLRIKIWKWTL